MVSIDLCQQQVCPGQVKYQEVLYLLYGGVHILSTAVPPLRGCSYCSDHPLVPRGTTNFASYPVYLSVGMDLGTSLGNMGY